MEKKSQTKVCSVCKKKKPFSEYTPRKGRRCPVYSSCKECNRKKRKKSYDLPGNREKSREYIREYKRTKRGKEVQRKYNQSEKGRIAIQKRMLKKRYDITLQQYEQMLDEQDGVCAICGRENKSKVGLSVDHNHKTGGVRGLLCFVCNTKLGHLEDLEFICKAKEYLSRYA